MHVSTSNDATVIETPETAMGRPAIFARKAGVGRSWLCPITAILGHSCHWVMERTFAWLNRNRRIAKDFGHSIRSATAFLYAAAAMLLFRR